jgi:hypothetical protein
MGHAVTVLVLMLVPTLAHAATPDAGRLTLEHGGSLVELDVRSEAELASAFELYVASCHPYEAVVGSHLPQSELERRWAEQAPLTHAVLRTSFGEEAPSHLRGKNLEILIGLETADGPAPLLARDERGRVSAFTKCPGLDGLVLTCRVHALVPGRSPHSDCERWRQLQQQEQASRAAAEPPAE